MSTGALDEALRGLVHAAVQTALAEQQQRPAVEPSGWLSAKSAARFLDVTEAALRARVKRDEIPVHRRDGRLYFDRAELDAYVRGVECRSDED